MEIVAKLSTALLHDDMGRLAVEEKVTYRRMQFCCSQKGLSNVLEQTP